MALLRYIQVTQHRRPGSLPDPSGPLSALYLRRQLKKRMQQLTFEALHVKVLRLSKLQLTHTLILTSAWHADYAVCKGLNINYFGI